MATSEDVASEFLETMTNKQRFGTNDAVSDDGSSESEPIDEQQAARSEEVNVEQAEEVAPAEEEVFTVPSEQPSSVSEFEKKKSCLVEIRCLKSKGVHFDKAFTFEDSLASMQEALELAKIEATQRSRDNRTKSGIKTARRILMAGVSMLEFLTKKWNPLRLEVDGFGEYVMGNIEDYDHVFERLLVKYQGKGTMEPEVELIVMLATSAVMFHISNRFVQNAIPAPLPQTAGPSTIVDDQNRFEDE
jgi:hypothetical protein